MSALRVTTPEDLRELMGEDFTLSPEQWQAVAAPLAPAVVIAGAGSGKTALMAARVVYLVANDLVRPEQVLGLTFTTKATAELTSRIRGALTRAGLLDTAPDTAPRGEETSDGDGAAETLEPTVATYNAYAASLLDEHGLRLGHEPDTRVVSDGARFQLAERAVAAHRGEVRELSDHPPTVVENLLALESELSEHLRDPDDVRRFDAGLAAAVRSALDCGEGQKKGCEDVLSAVARRRELLGLVEDYRALKRRLGLMDFSDQVALAARLALGHPEVGAAERARYRVVLLDEYQDTSVAQARMLAALFSGEDQASGRGHAVTAVGDPNQAIYGWRGASVSNILRFSEYFPPLPGEVAPAFALTVNRRSDRRILEAANAVADPLYAGRTVARLAPKPTAEEGAVDVVVHETAAEELAWAARTIARAGAERRRGGEGVAWSDIGVLVRDNAHAAAVFDALTEAGVPVEIVGLKGLLRLPEVAEVVATLSLVHDLADNASLLTLLTGPRWAVGPRDLALLGQRARDLTGLHGRPEPGEQAIPLVDRLDEAVSGSDPVDVPALLDALDDPGDPGEGHDYSPEARARFAWLAEELRLLRAHAGEPLLDLVRRVVDVTGIDVELASSNSPAAPARRDNLDLFVKAVADFTGLDGQVSLAALLAWIRVEEDGEGLDVATPSESDSVKLLTVHRAKGLEFDQVWLLGVCEEKFPNTTSRPSWATSPKVLPAPLRGDHEDLPQLRAHDVAGFAAFKAERAAHQEQEERRLGYVALTRARHRMWVSSYVWTEGRQGPLGPSPYQAVVRDVIAGHGVEPEKWIDRPEKGTPNPLQDTAREVAWPSSTQTREAAGRAAAAALVQVRSDDLPPEQAAVLDALASFGAHEDDLDLTERALVAEWDAELDRLVAEARRRGADTIEVPSPAHLSATAVARLHEDPAAFARELARPMPRQPSPASRFGTRFHEWVETRFGQLGLLDVDELDGRGDLHVDSEHDLADLVAAFESGPFADRPPYAVEAPFSLLLGDQVVRGRIDAVYAEPSGPAGESRWLLVDWKTSRRHDADPLQLALYRLAWAELHDVDPAQVRAAFFYVRTQTLVEPSDLPDRAALEALLPAPGTATPRG